MSTLNEELAMEGNEQMLSFMSNFKVMVNHCAVLYSINEIKYDWNAFPAGVVIVERFFLGILSNLANFSCFF